MTDTDVLTLKSLTYENSWGKRVDIFYVLKGQDVYFTGLDLSNLTTMAGEAVEVICRQEAISWQDYTFSHILTHVNARGAIDQWDFRVDRLGIADGDELVVVTHTVTAWRRGGEIILRDGDHVYVGIDPDIQHAFDEFIEYPA